LIGSRVLRTDENSRVEAAPEFLNFIEIPETFHTEPEVRLEVDPIGWTKKRLSLDGVAVWGEAV
jgi:hypothetical protein